MVLFQNFWNKWKRFAFAKKIVGTHQKVLVLFQNFWNKEKRSTVGSGTHQNVLVSFRSLASISEHLCFRFDFANITRAPANTLTLLQQSQVNVKAIRVLVEAVSAGVARESAIRGLETVADA